MTFMIVSCLIAICCLHRSLGIKEPNWFNGPCPGSSNLNENFQAGSFSSKSGWIYSYGDSSLVQSEFNRSVTCSWNITVSPGSFVRFRFTALSFKPPRYECNRAHWVSLSNIRANATVSGVKTLKLCSYSKPEHYFTTIGRKSTVQFSLIPEKFDQEDVGRIFFNVTFDEVDSYENSEDRQSCPTEPVEILNQDIGTIYSYRTAAGTYRSNETCKWLVRNTNPHVAYRFRLLFLNIEDICPCKKETCLNQCKNDHLTIWNGDNDDYTENMILRKCGVTTHFVCLTMSSSNTALVVFKSNHRLEYDGFVLEFEALNADNIYYVDDNNTPFYIHSDDAPNGYVASYRKRNGKLRIPGESYWVLDFPTSLLSFKFTQFYIGLPDHCYAYLEVFYGEKHKIRDYVFDCSNPPKNQTYYMSKQPQGISKTVFKLWAKERESEGFNLSYEGVPYADIATCNDIENILAWHDNRTVTIKNYVRRTGTFRNADDCSWLLSGSVKSTLTLTVTSLHIDPCPDDGSCNCNYLLIFDGANETVPLLNENTTCGTLSDQLTFTSSGNVLLIRFVTADYTQWGFDPSGKGFEAKYEMIIHSEDSSLALLIAAVVSSFVGAIVITVIVIVTARSHYQKKALAVRESRLKTIDSLLGDMYIVPVQNYKEFMDDVGCSEFRDIIETLVILPEQLKLLEDGDDSENVIGEGSYGIVHRGTLKRNDGSSHDVAVKSLKTPNTSTTQLADFLREGFLMHLLNHDRILKILGIVLRDADPNIVFPFMKNGNLYNYLYRNALVKNFPQSRYLAFCLQVCSGMCYLESRKCIHRDLACRNILVDESLNLKISDFGFAKELGNSNCYYKLTDLKKVIPIRWYPPEALKTPYVFKLGSDVWSFGVLCWEIFEAGYGGLPYGLLSSEQVRDLVLRGGTLERPRNCPDKMFTEVMTPSWTFSVESRPSFNTLKLILQKILDSCNNDI